MQNKIAKFFLYTVVIAIVALFAVNEVRAFSDEPCYGLNYDENCPEPLMIVEQEGWQIWLKSVTETTTDVYDWHYEVKNISTGTASGANFLAMLIPDCCTDPKIDVYIDQGTLFKDYFEVAVGEPTVKFGMYNEQARVAKGTADNTINWHLITNTNVKTSSTILLSVKKLGALTFEMAVPGCEPASPHSSHP